MAVDAFSFKKKIKKLKGEKNKKAPTKRIRHFPNRMVKIKNAINEGEGVEEGGNPPFMVMQIWFQNNNELKTTPPEKD